MIKITSVRVKKVHTNDTRLLGVASIQLDDCLVIHDLKLLQLKDKRVVRFPNKRITKYTLNNNQSELVEEYAFTDVVHPSNSEFRNYVESELFKIYDNLSDDTNTEVNN